MRMFKINAEWELIIHEYKDSSTSKTFFYQEVQLFLFNRLDPRESEGPLTLAKGEFVSLLKNILAHVEAK